MLDSYRLVNCVYLELYNWPQVWVYSTTLFVMKCQLSSIVPNQYFFFLEDEIAKEEEDIKDYDEDEKPLGFDDFKKRFQIKHSLYNKKEGAQNALA